MAEDARPARPGNDALRLALIAALALLLYWALWPAVTGDMEHFLLPWLDTILERGQVGAFSRPFANYTPPYLYLLALASPLAAAVPKVSLIKAISLAATLMLAVAGAHLVRSSGRDRWPEAALWLVLLPSVAINAAGLGQCDALWSAACVMAVAASINRRPVSMLLWFGVALSFKAQAIFLAPFIFQRLICQRVPAPLWAIPALVYGVAVLPAALAGWPLGDLFTIYLRQAAWNPDFIGNAANPWSVVQLVAPLEGARWLWAGQVAAVAATAAYLYRFRRFDGGPARLLALALLSSLMLPFLLPKMHERFFFLADVLAFLLVFIRRDWRSFAIFCLVEGASLLALWGVLLNDLSGPIIGAVMTATAMLTLYRELGTAEDCDAGAGATVAEP